ncbi:hypothetical protein CCR85_10805 [Rhodothalassium salexigens]|uniref:c-type cytochrome n=1 Tax=Rhodothalassium salexigens TaxID=1086 RepID=UPI0019134272|nr:c-type cytochrome [Rhodothalassium salexigens]MBK5911978.1 hypothetical protein [Rhodothalassium salexigens]MBK5922142.1 hypothetical protein [Rhodothalassium salexigens]
MLGAAVSVLLAGCAGPDARRASDADPGRQAYLGHCAVCHGVDGAGDGMIAGFLTVKPTDLTRLSADNDGRFPRRRVEWSIDGRGEILLHGSRAMPIWGNAFRYQTGRGGIGFFDEQDDDIRRQIDQLVDYIERLQRPSGDA